MRILCVGDLHGNLAWANRFVIPQAQGYKCKTIFQVGDFGYWEHTKAGQVYLDSLSERLEEAGIRLIFLLGNHENWDMIEKYRNTYSEEDRSTEGFYKIRPNLYWAPCGSQWQWGGVRFGAVGGAFSVDRAARKQGWSWWPQEVIDDEKASDIIDVTEKNSVDVMFAHDAPSDVDMFHHMWINSGARPMPIKASYDSRHYLQKIVDHWNPKLFIHGHWHCYYNETIEDCRYIGLDCDRSQDANICVIDIDAFKLSVTEPYKMTATGIRG